MSPRSLIGEPLPSNEIRRGVIYILANKYMPDVVKIGQTTRDVETRARELSRPTGVPADFEVIYDEVVSDVNAAEEKIHVLLSAWRVNRSREFFKVGIRDAIKLVQSVGRQFEVNEEADASEIEILPQLEDRMRRWLRREIVSVKFVQFSDLCLLRVTEQPDLKKMEAFQRAADLRVFADGDYEDDLLFTPAYKTIRENVATFIELDPYSMIMTSLGLLTDEAADYVAYLVQDLKIDPPLRPGWKVSSIRYDLWGPPDDEDNLSILRRLHENDARRLGDRNA
jgi:hypothetical protein